MRKTSKMPFLAYIKKFPKANKVKLFKMDSELVSKNNQTVFKFYIT
jgi:hypothetical protein